MKEDLKVDLHLMKYQVLRFLNTANESVTLKQIKSHLVGYFNLSEEYVHELRPSGLNKIFDNNVGWSLEQLKNAETAYAEYLWFKAASSEAVGRHLADWYGNS